MTWKDDIKKRKLYVRSGLADEAKTFLKDVEEHLDSIMPAIKQEFANYPEYDRKQIEKVILSTLKEDIDNIKRSLKSEQVILAGLEMTRQVELKPPPENKRRKDIKDYPEYDSLRRD